MKKISIFLGGILFIFIFTGAGCADMNQQKEDKNTFETKPAFEVDGIEIDAQTDAGIEVEIISEDDEEEKTENKQDTSNESDVSVTNDTFKLRLGNIGKGTVQLRWDRPDDIENTELRIYRGPENNPGPDHNYWVNPGPNATEYSWQNLEPRVEYFRICLWQNGICKKFSENISVEVE